MAEKSLNELPRDLRELHQKGTVALQRQNYDYAVAIFTQILQREPGCLEARQALRAAQIKKAGGGAGFFKKVLGGASNQPLIAKAQMVKSSKPLEALQIAEQILAGDPGSASGNRIIAEAALAAGLPKTACFALEMLLKNSPDDYELSMQYGEALAAAGQVTKAEQVYQDLMAVHPTRGEIAAALKNLSARKTLSEQGYEKLAGGTGSYRDALKDKAGSVAIEQENRQVKNEDVADRLIAEYEARVVQEPGNFKLLRNIAELYAQKRNFDKSLEYYARLQASEAGNDPSLERAVADTTLRRFDHLLGQLDANDPAQAEQAARLRAERTDFHLTECQRRAEKYPTDLQIRFDLAQLYFQAGKLSESIQEFQKAQAHPHRRLQAMSGLGQCFAARNMNDMAARKFQEALKEKPTFDDEKKELLYQLGLVLDKMGKKEEAIEQFKQIYEVDIGYKDVGARVEAFYAGQ
jgi:tetratricopeptide (TPR) repeat protein